MDAPLNLERWTKASLELLTETFETHHGIYLDAGTSLFETLKTISADQASVPVGGECATLAAQVAHVNFYLEVLERYIQTGDAGDPDWGEIWRTVREVSAEEWTVLINKLRVTYDRIHGMLSGGVSWDDDYSVDGALAIIVHSAYHLGEIRQALCTLRSVDAAR
jgi:hypothetical protein